MEATFKLSINELDCIFLDKINTVFTQSAMMEIKISNEYDETDYLLFVCPALCLPDSLY
ncbi:MAG: hypothetical protein ABRQ38_02300 [Candidatus Eremiobacterota bacterium]